MRFRSKTDFCGRGLRKYKSMFRWPQNGRSTSNAFKQGWKFFVFSPEVDAKLTDFPYSIFSASVRHFIAH